MDKFREIYNNYQVTSRKKIFSIYILKFLLIIRKMYGEQSKIFLENVKLNLPIMVETSIIPRKINNTIINTGRWKENEHKKFLEAIIMYGNDWKCVHKFIKSRSSTQARSHAQKFLLKLRKKLKIIPTYDSISQTMKISNDSIQKIIREIVESSSMKNAQIDKEKLVKLIMGFSNLLIGKIKPPQNSSDFPLISSSSSYGNYSLLPEGVVWKQDEINKKVFIIEKINRKNLFNQTSNIPNHFLIEKLKKLDPNILSQTEIKTNNIQITNQDELLKLLLQQQNQTIDQSNPNKNVINIISINICNKKDSESLEKAVPINLNSNLNKKTNNKVQINNQNVYVNKEQFQNIQITMERMNSTSCLNNSTDDESSIENQKVSIDQDFYEESSSFFGLNPRNVEDEVDGFFNL